MYEQNELLTIKLLYKFQEEFPNIEMQKVRNILDDELNNYIVQTKSMDIIVSDLPEKIELFLGSKKLDGLSDTTLSTYFYELNTFQKYIHKPVIQIGINDIRKYLYFIQQEKEYKKSTINSKINILKTFFTFLNEEEIIAKNPTLKIKSNRVDKKLLREALTVEEIELLRNACVDIREKTILEFIYSSGCRLTEAVNVKIKDINFNERTLKVIGKGNKQRWIFFSTKCKIYLLEYLDKRNDKSEFMFVGIRKPHKQLSDSGIQKIIKKIASRTNINKSIHPHLLRHSFATHMLASGMDLNIIQKLLGHDNPGTTQIYAKINTETLKYEYNKLLS